MNFIKRNKHFKVFFRSVEDMVKMYFDYYET